VSSYRLYNCVKSDDSTTNVSDRSMQDELSCDYRREHLLIGISIMARMDVDGLTSSALGQSR
jgi:hypothetical protein